MAEWKDDDYWISGDFRGEALAPIETVKSATFQTASALQDEQSLANLQGGSYNEDIFPALASFSESQSKGLIRGSSNKEAVDEGSDYSSDDEPDAKFCGMEAGSTKQRIVTLGCLSCSCCCCIWTIIIVTCLVCGYRFVKKNPALEQPLGVMCPPDVEFCNWNRGFNTPPNNITRYLRWPGCGIQGPMFDSQILECGPPCFDEKLVTVMDSYNSLRPWKMITFPSAPPDTLGQEEVNLTGWWLPVDQVYNNLSFGERAPVIIVMHALGHNFNMAHVQVYAFLLRSIGFNVFIPNLRDTGNSKTSSKSQHITWGWTYYLDLLGAWQHVVNDPKSEFGGARPVSQVGIAGLDTGAMLAATVLGLEHRIVGAWLDSGLYAVERGALADEIQRYGYAWFMGWFFRWMAPMAYEFAEHFAGVDISHKTPSNSLPCTSLNGTRQKVSLISNTKDTIEVRREAEHLEEIFGEHPLCYDFTSEWVATAECHGVRSPQLFAEPEEYRKRSCQFWSSVFQRDATVCDAGDPFPALTPVKPAISSGGSSGSSSSAGQSSSSAASGSLSRSVDESSMSQSSSSNSLSSFDILRSSFSSVTSAKSSSAGR